MNFEEIYQQLEDAVNAAITELNESSGLETELNHKEQQLVHIEKTIRQFQEKAVPVPDELRNLKLKLVMEVDQLKQYNIFKDKITRLIQSNFSLFQNATDTKSTKQRRKKRKSGGRISLKDMIDTNTIQAGQEIYAQVKGEITRAKITPEGQIKVLSTGQCYDTPSSAAVAVTNISVNGWTFWHIKDGSKERELDYYRKRHKRLMNSEA